MKIASITVYCNEEYRVKNWRDFYEEYKDSIATHIIVNNGNECDNNMLKESFPNSIILYSPNRSLTSAYNVGFKEAMRDPDVDAILIVGNDMKISSKGIAELYELLFCDEFVASVSPVILYKDCQLIETYGAAINFKTVTFAHIHEHDDVNLVKEDEIVCEALPGGMNMTKRKVYEECGLQDETLFMYVDELDTGIRYKKAGYKMLATKKVLSWHQHINKGEKKYRNLYVPYLIGRNNMYIAKKHFGFTTVSVVALIHIFNFIIGILASIKNLSFFQIKENFAYLNGSYKGLIGNMDNSFMIQK